MKPTHSRPARGWNLGTRIILALILGMGAMFVTSERAHAGFGGSHIYNNSPVGIGIVTNLGDGYSYILAPYRWSPWNAKGGYTGWGWCTNVYYDFGNGWEYRFQVRGAKFWSIAYLATEYARADSWRC